jgi:hypothetical protein
MLMTSFRNGLCWATILLCISCTRVKVGDEELKAVNKVVELIGGRCAYGLRFEATPKGRSSYFTLTLSESIDLELLSDIPELPASGAAYTFYSNLSTPNNYTHIEVSLKYKNGEEKEYVYSVEELESVKRQMPKVFNITRLLQDRRFDSLGAMLNDSSYIQYNKMELLKNVEKYERQFGALKEFVPFGYKFQDVEKGSVNLHISGMTFRNQDFVRFSIDLDTTEKSNRVIVLNYKY